MFDKLSFKYKIAQYFSKKLLKFNVLPKLYPNQRADVIVKVLLQNNNEILLFKGDKNQEMSKFKVASGILDLENFDTNENRCIQTVFENVNLSLDIIEFSSHNLIDIHLEHSQNASQIVYIYLYKLTDTQRQEIDQSNCEIFSINLEDLEFYNKKKRFIDLIDYKILTSYKGRLKGESRK
jgi:hypothetical protein